MRVAVSGGARRPYPRTRCVSPEWNRALHSGMRLPDHFDDDEDDPFPLGDGTAETEATVYCPYCGEPNEVGLDPGSGAAQEYVEDCQVCCRPWRVLVAYRGDGSADVRVEAADAE
jgi:hypothetical protein